MKWRWWHRWVEEPEGNGEAAAKARADAAENLKAVEERWPEVHRASNIFAARVEDAFRRRRQA